MSDILDKLYIVVDTLMRFLVFLGPNLKAVTGNSKGIDNLVEEVKELTIPFKNSEYNYFERSNFH